MKSNRQLAFLVVLTTVLLACPAMAQRDRSLNCDRNWHGWKDREGHCEMKEQTIPATGGLITVDGYRNGGVSVKGWERNEILVRTQITAHAPTAEAARALVAAVRIETAGANIHPVGPESRDEHEWGASFEVFVPRQSNLSLKAHNGGISIDNVHGSMEFETHNGGASLRGLSGKVYGRTRNGGLSVSLAGNRWEGEGLDVETRNGGVNLLIPENYSARLETGTVNGGVNLGFPITVQGKLERNFTTELGGGALIRVMTRNGGVTVKRQ